MSLTSNCLRYISILPLTAHSMSRSASDATRFTSTTPHASSILHKGNPKKPLSRTPGLSGETPQERVRRLRAMADTAREAQMSKFDRWIARGRVWADIAHTITTTTLIAASIIAGGVTIYAMTDMIIYNRRKKAQFFEEQKAKLELAISTARQAIKDGVATEEQINFIKMEDEHQAELEAKKLNSSLSKKISKSKDWLFSGLNLEESLEDKANREERESNGSRNDPTTGSFERTSADLASQTKQAFADEKQRLLDNMLHDETSPSPALKDEGKSNKLGWMSWITGR